MTQKEFIESYTKQQNYATKMLFAMKNNNSEELTKYSAAFMLEIFKNHTLTDKKSMETVDKIVNEFLVTENIKNIIPSLEIEDEDEEREV